MGAGTRTRRTSGGHRRRQENTFELPQAPNPNVGGPQSRGAALVRPTQRPASHLGSTLWEIGRHNGCGHPCPRWQPATFAASSPARLRVTTRGVHSMGQHAPGATRVKAQPSFVSQGRSSGTPPSSGRSMLAPFAAGSADPPFSRVDAQARTAMQRITNAFTDGPCSGPIPSVNSEAASDPARFRRGGAANRTSSSNHYQTVSEWLRADPYA